MDHAASEVSDELMVLRLYAEAARAIPQRIIAGKLGWSLGKANRLVRDLINKGMLFKDTRGTCLTDQGRFELHEMFPDRFEPPPDPDRFQLPF